MKYKTDTSYDSSLKFYLDEISRYQLLTFEEEVELAEKIADGDEAARQRMINSNLRLVVKMARGYQISGVSLMDLIQEGNLGLIKAAERYDFRKNVRFCTYAAWWIKQAITRYLTDRSRSIRLPYRKEEALRHIQDFMHHFSIEHKRSPSLHEISDGTKVKYNDVVSIMEFSANPISLYAETNIENGTLMDILVDDNYNPDGELFKKCAEQDTRNSLYKLKDNERNIIRYRYNFVDGKKHTLKTIGEQMGISPETVRQIEIRALKKLKEEAPELKEYMFA
ncbi:MULTISPECIES: RNA polymerase sigma factor RpoD/SigA [unclassified Oceanispirochaeta]|uniref:sigma-70 family RNA polymerase sigma factor n=1 Tax=unclassified Oceanispirochaeta TaxID=2635722 RepID=UPI000E09493E|nr:MULTISPECIES: RNA polymerase sigma factor RpoD/SigA [unclassified Oceanispirochaeta]MBF9018080.1 RNA polymerase sigma factor RpoD/SigA [Oceanispirochaeta sp. M2]NPD74544.1 RNA polymerase sigma factor RpoD/SigA [Oceanispirochaeta sp. M1]RDG29575.1 RNA polymerase sigma factor RpoD/SigA [Oceanispirochaeta sp. M1]